jgi:enterochelin esterase family protein
MSRLIHSLPGLAFLICTGAFAQQAPAPAPTPARPARPQPPTRDPNTPGYVKAKELPDGTVPSPKQNGNFIIGPTHPTRYFRRA